MADPFFLCGQALTPPFTKSFSLIKSDMNCRFLGIPERLSAQFHGFVTQPVMAIPPVCSATVMYPVAATERNDD